MPGPQFETPAEIRALKALGVDIVSMSTAPEATVASAMGMQVLGLASVANLAAGMTSEPLSHQEVLAAGRKNTESLMQLLGEIMGNIA